jgi:hypothetical protein
MSDLPAEKQVAFGEHSTNAVFVVNHGQTTDIILDLSATA